MKELVDGDLKEQNNIIFKFRKPQSYYLKWTEGSQEGMECIFSKGKYNDKDVVHLAGILKFITLRLDPEGSLAKRGRRHSIIEADIGYIIRTIRTNYEKAKIAHEGVFSITAGDSTMSFGILVITAEFPEGKDYYSQRIIIQHDTVLGIPVKFSVIGWEGELIEEYSFSNIVMNSGLTDKDFDIDNPSYGY
jgi:hypothetical protein